MHRISNNMETVGENFDSLVFLHIPKTAGSTFHTILGERYSATVTKNLFGSRYEDLEIKNFIELTDTHKSKIKLLKGHMPFGLHKYLPGTSKYISILRDPIERVISQYYYIKANTRNPLHEQVVGGNMTISEIVSSGISVGLNNGQCRFLNGDISEYAFNQCNEMMLKNVKENITKHYLWLGITERFDESLLVLANKIGWKKTPYYFRQNTSKTRVKKAATADEDILAIKEFNQLDIALYDFANNILDKEIKKINGFTEQLAQFKQKNAILQKRWGWLPDKVRKYIK